MRSRTASPCASTARWLTPSKLVSRSQRGGRLLRRTALRLVPWPLRTLQPRSMRTRWKRPEPQGPARTLRAWRRDPALRRTARRPLWDQPYAEPPRARSVPARATGPDVTYRRCIPSAWQGRPRRATACPSTRSARHRSPLPGRRCRPISWPQLRRTGIRCREIAELARAKRERPNRLGAGASSGPSGSQWRSGLSLVQSSKLGARPRGFRAVCGRFRRCVASAPTSLGGSDWRMGRSRLGWPDDHRHRLRQG
jgi:hypothetical protein